MPKYQWKAGGVMEAASETAVVEALKVAVTNIETKEKGKLFAGGARVRSITVGEVEPKAST